MSPNHVRNPFASRLATAVVAVFFLLLPTVCIAQNDDLPPGKLLEKVVAK